MVRKGARRKRKAEEHAFLERCSENKVEQNAVVDVLEGASEILKPSLSNESHLPVENPNDNGCSDDDGRKYLLRECTQFLSLLPEELWIFILDYIDDNDNTTLENASNASGFFRNILLPRRVNFLFPKICGILSIRSTTCDTLRGYNKKKRRRMCSPSPLLSVCDVLKLRLVCQKWCTSVDGYFENENDHQYKMKMDVASDWTHESQDRHGDVRSKFVNKFSFGDRFMLSKFTKHFESTHDYDSGTDTATQRSPFLNRKVVIDYTHLEAHRLLKNFYHALKCMLLKFGQHIWHCEFTFKSDFPVRNIFYTKLKELVEAMPNLNTVHITCIRTSEAPIGWNSSIEYEPQSPTISQLAQLEKVISSNPLAKLKQLKFMKIRGVGVPSCILNELIRSNNHIAILEMERGTTYGDLNMDNILSAPNLEQLSLNIRSQQEFESLHNSISNLPWKLSKLSLDFEQCPFIEWSRVFSMISEGKWTENVTNLVIHLPHAKQTEEEDKLSNEISSLRLFLPKVKVLKLAINNFTSLDFLMPIKGTLEYLEVSIRKCGMDLWREHRMASEVENNQTIQFLGYFNSSESSDRLMDSNIWQLFPNLSNFNLKCEYSTTTGTGRRRAACKEETKKEFYFLGRRKRQDG